jgi:phospholipase D1/2
MSSVRTGVSKIFHSDPLSNVHLEHEDETRSDSASSVVSSALSRDPTPMLDPSTNKNPLQLDGYEEHGEDKHTIQTKDAPVPRDVSKHTFYVLNSQTRLKVSAKNEVCNALSNLHKIYSLLICLLFSASNDAVHYCPREDRGRL